MSFWLTFIESLLRLFRSHCQQLLEALQVSGALGTHYSHFTDETGGPSHRAETSGQGTQDVHPGRLWALCLIQFRFLGEQAVSAGSR